MRIYKFLKINGIEPEIIDLRTLRPIDKKTIINSVKKTRKLLVIDNSWTTYGISAEIISIVTESIFKKLKKSPQRIGIKNVMIPSSKELAKHCYLNSKNIFCYKSIEELDNSSLDTVFGFHSLEHVGNPIEILSGLRKKIVDKGYVIFEVPHANDFLIENLKCSKFIDFTLWSQHLILHTRQSLQTFLFEAGYSNITIQAKQRYSVANHLYWLTNGKPGGHKSDLSLIDTTELKNAYERSLQMINATDTLIAVAQV